MMLTAPTPRCCMCAFPLASREAMIIGRQWQPHRCPSCGASLHLRAAESGFAVRPAAPDCAPLPAVASPSLRSRFHVVCKRVARLLRGQGVEPGMASIDRESDR